MRSRVIALILLAAAAATLWLAHPAPADDPSTAQLGKKIDNFALVDDKNQTVMLHDVKDKKAIVLVFLSFDCPVSNSYSQLLAEMSREFRQHGVAFLGLTVNQEDSRAGVAKHARDWDLPFPVVLDNDLVAADALQAKITPEVFVLDGNHVLRYRGRIDNSYSRRLLKNQQVTQHDLRQVLSEMISGRPVSVQATSPIGCPIGRTVPPAPKVGSVTYYKDVLPILQNRCQQCHRAGEVGPFELMTYRHAVKWASDIKDFTQSRRMPPWKISAGIDFHNDRRLTAHEIAVLAAWVDGATPEGNPKDAPPAKTFSDGWQLGTPDLVLTASDDFQVGPTGNDVFRCFVLPTHLTEDKYVSAVEVRPGNARVVHHALLYIDTAGAGRKLEQRQKDNPQKDPHGGNELDKGPGYYGGMGVGFLPTRALGGWAPGQLPRHLSEGIGIKLPSNSDVVMQLHYHRNGRTEKDKTRIGIYFAKKAVDKPLQGGFMMGRFRTIPAGNEHFVVKGTAKVLQDLTLFDIMPHMHMRGKEIKVTMTPPDGQPALIFHIKEWDYNWQESYFFKQPLQLKTGTQLDLEAVFDNSAGNPNNPFNPPKDAKFGEQTTDEMCFVFFAGVSERASYLLPLSLPSGRIFQEFLPSGERKKENPKD